MHIFCRRFLLLVPLAYGAPLHAMVALSDGDLAAIDGQDGISIDLGLDSSIAQVEAQLDAGTARQASLFLDNVALQSSALGGGPVTFSSALDIGGNSTGGSGGSGLMLLQTQWNNARLTVDAVRHSGQAANSFGAFAFQGSGSLKIGTEGGLLNAASGNGIFDLSTNGDWIMRQGAPGSPELSLGNISLGARFTDGTFDVNGKGNPGNGTIGADSQGLIFSAPFMDFDLNFDLLFKPNPTNFDTTNRQSAILFGWEGGLRDATIRVGSGGLGQGAGATISPGPSGFAEFDVDGSLGSRTDGLNLFAEWNYDTTFSWILGQAGGNRTRARFFDWQALGDNPATVAREGGTPIDFRMPIIVDVVNAGQDAGGICFGGNLPTSGSLTGAACTSIGGTLENVAPNAGSLAFLIRDGRLHAFNTKVEVIDPNTATPSETFNWSLLYTFGKLDLNAFIQATAAGVPSANITLAIQSPGYWAAAQDNFATVTPGNDPRDRWATNTHLMIADTSTAVDVTGDGVAGDAFGIGLVNSDIFWKTSDLTLAIGSTGGASPRGRLRLETNTLAQYRVRGLFGGGSLLTTGGINGLQRPVRVSLVDANLFTDFFRFDLLSAPIGEEFLGFAGIFDLNPSSFLSLAEPSQPQADFRLKNVRGRVAWENGQIRLTSASATPADPRPRLTIENDITFGSTAGGAPFRADVGFGSSNLGQLAVPSGRWHGAFTLKKQ